NQNAGRCLAKPTSVCTEQEWEAANAQSYKACTATSPFKSNDDDRQECGFGKVYERVPGKAVDALYGRMCADPKFCTVKEAICIQGDKTKAHCCVMPRNA
ncbi:hypothetical protein PENTCL1PPCAC_10537, partial [Pristionchus entomophagus]